LQIFEAWEKSKKSKNNIIKDPFELRREILWQNKNIKINKKEVFYQKWYKNGIIILHDILKENGEFKSAVELQTEYKVDINVMEYNSLKSAIPNAWKIQVKNMKIPPQAISNDEQPFFICGNQPFAISILLNRNVYWEYVSRKEVIPASARRWCRDYGINQDNWKSVYRFFASIKDTKMKAFQYKIINILLPCNLYLRIIGKSETDKCDRCGKLDDIVHYIVKCPATTLLWQQVNRWWNNLTSQDIVISEQDIMLGLKPRINKIEKEEQLNVIILAVKWKIHANKQDGQETCLYQAMIAVKQMIDTLECIACRNMKKDRHDKVWGEIKDHLK
jgi:hypothetical protein